MANSLCFSPLISFNAADKPGPVILHAGRKTNWLSDATYSSRSAAFTVLKAADKKSSTKSTSILCTDCEGNGAKKCPQCEGTGVNSVDHFNGQFKAGTLCWLCRGKKEVLCGNCNGAGFMGGFMSTFDD
ncbi:UNVERIFIED_CONTAM: protein BUNDLE SHEATH defective, chloroplastic [Sesamum latifolium]|uniref:Protein BUNDLE SHEATH defective, chloroplastic n=1 Tax=Sesamum latifolium TaxID=2727402 RepID=A0AAW2VH88_9LAMI